MYSMCVPRNLGKLLLAVTAATSMSGCAHQWESLLDGNLHTRASMNRYPVSIVAVDGEYSTINPRRVDAGERRLTIDAPPIPNFREPVRKEFTFKVEKCVRYWLAAQRATALTQDFELVIDHAEPIAGCMPYGQAQSGQVTPSDTNAPRPIPKPKR
ncbi:MAG: hypothetical protein ACRCWJ_17090 [Casimicrobium sp.]